MADLTQLVEQAQKGDITVAYLREHYEPERVLLAEANETSSTKGWMECKDLLVGETAVAKRDNYIARAQALGAANAEIIKDLEVRQLAANLPQLPAQPSASKQFGEPMPDSIEALTRAAEKMAEARYAMPMTPESFHIKQMEVDLRYKGFIDQSPSDRMASLTPGRMLAQTKSRDYIPVLKVSSFFGSGTSTQGILPSDRIGMPYPLFTEELMFMRIFEEEGSVLRYFQSRNPDVATSGTDGDAQVRARNAGLHVITDTGALIERNKRSLGAIAKVPREDIRDNGRIATRTQMQLDVGVKDQMVEQIFNGVHATENNWDGIMPAFNAAPANIGALGITHNSVPVLATGDDREPIKFLTKLQGELALRGCHPTVLFVNNDTWGEIKESQRVLRNQGMDYERAPLGMVNNAIPMCLSRHLGANQALLIDTSKAFEVVLGDDVDTAISEHIYFTDNAIGIRRSVYGNIALMMPFGAIKITDTNNFVAASFS